MAGVYTANATEEGREYGSTDHTTPENIAWLKTQQIISQRYIFTEQHQKNSTGKA